ncbi:PREDICTED: ATP-binding cassette sub-family G member 4 isoform X2 [Dinoponera quadriceps]|nr:PREDICTED: ATP-binding cassette sub-family G member 4 isoform X2 [Dinoponera quadriceps]
MMITSYLKLNRTVSHESRQMLIAKILETLSLSQTKETRVSRLSGGQRKRLSIALEIIDNPPVMFLDEPTTGLDSMSSHQCVSVLKTLARAGRTIICTIHQPSAAIYQMFDHIYLLVDGHCMYHSSPNDTIEYFAQQGLQCPQYHNPADYMLEVVTREYGNYDEQLIATAKCLDWPKGEEECSREPSNNVKVLNDDQMLSPPSELTRFWVLLQRYAILAYRDYSTVRVKIVLHFLVAVLLGLLFEQAGNDGSKTISNISYMQVTTLYLFYTGMMPAVLKFPLEVNILRKERFNNWYQLKTYYVATMVCMLPFQIIFAFIYSFVSYFMTSQPLEYSRFLMYLLVAILTNLTSEAIGLWLGALFNPINGIFIGSVIACIMLSLTGFMIFFIHMPKFFKYISYVNIHRYIFDGLVYAVYNNREKLPCPTIYCHYRMPNTILEELSMSKSIFWVDVAILFAFLIMFRILAYVTLKRRLSKID